MSPLHARYPFFDAAREAVGAAGVDLGTLVVEEAPAVERGRERVERALLEGTVAAESPERWTPTDELLSYPIARILVSLLDSRAAIDKYAEAEAATAAERFEADFEAPETELRSVTTAAITRERVLSEFGLESTIRPAENRSDPSRGPERFEVHVGTYLRLSSADWGDRWRLVNGELDEGWVIVADDDLQRLLREAVRRRVADGLPFEGLDENAEIATALESQLTDLHRLLSQRQPVGEIDFVARELFPPCIENLVQKAEADTELDPFESFALMAFLTGIGMDADDIVAFCRESSLDPEGIRFQTEYLRDDVGTQYPPPSCETLSAYGICHNEDDHWQTAPNPLAYYQERVAEAGDEVTDWREKRRQEA
ncbi:DNA primase [Haloferacaceae archaeon DSL9]